MSKVITRTIDVTIIQSENIYVTSCEYKDVSTEVQVLMDRFVKGDKGDPPTRGVDYWTDKDVLEFKDYCVNVITQQWFGTEAQYEYMYKHGQIQPDWIYFIYEDENIQQTVVVNGNTMTVTKALLSEDLETLTIKGTIDNDTLILSGTVLYSQLFYIEDDTLIATGVSLSPDRKTLILQGKVNNETLNLENI